MRIIKAIQTKLFKAVLFALVANYLFFSVGIIKATHFCMGREASVAFFSSEAEKCFCSKFLSEEKNACCDDKQEVIKIDTDQKTVGSFYLQIADLTLLEVFDLNLLVNGHGGTQGNTVVDENRDKPPKVPLYKSLCSFVFYDSILTA